MEKSRKNLDELMTEKELSFEDLSEEIKIDSQTLRRWYRNSIPKAESLIKIADYFGCSCDYLLGFTEEIDFKPDKIQPNFYSRYLQLSGRVKPKGRDSKIADYCHISRSTVFRWKKGTMPDTYILIKLCEMFDCSFEFLLGRSEY